MQSEDPERVRALADVASALRRLEAQRSAASLVHQGDAQRGTRRTWLSHWYFPGADTPWWGFGLRLGFWLAIAAGVEQASVGEGWHSTSTSAFEALLGVAEVAWRARRKMPVGRRPDGSPALIWGINRWRRE